jgi:hypothetical protein
MVPRLPRDFLTPATVPVLGTATSFLDRLQIVVGPAKVPFPRFPYRRIWFAIGTVPPWGGMVHRAHLVVGQCLFRGTGSLLGFLMVPAASWYCSTRDMRAVCAYSCDKLHPRNLLVYSSIVRRTIAWWRIQYMR